MLKSYELKSYENPNRNLIVVGIRAAVITEGGALWKFITTVNCSLDEHIHLLFCVASLL